MKIQITIDTDNAAFDDGNTGPEVARILRALSRCIEADRGYSIALFDGNGNAVGECTVTR